MEHRRYPEVALSGLGEAYTNWAGLGVVLATLAAVATFEPVPDPAALAGISLIVAGVVVLNVFSETMGHGTESSPQVDDVVPSVAATRQF